MIDRFIIFYTYFTIKVTCCLNLSYVATVRIFLILKQNVFRVAYYAVKACAVGNNVFQFLCGIAILHQHQNKDIWNSTILFNYHKLCISPMRYIAICFIFILFLLFSWC
jgi:hypothetical protein